MSVNNGASTSSTKLSHTAAISLFIVSMVSFVAETQLTQYTQTSLGFRQPYLIFYVVHSSFAIIFPLHFLYLIVIEKHSPRGLIDGLRTAITAHMTSSQLPARSSPFPTRPFIILSVILTVTYSLPALLWFISITLASVSDVTAIWNTNAFWAYILTVKVYDLKWEPRRLMAVLLATAGVMIVVYGGNTSTSSDPQSLVPTAGSPITGDILTLLASVIYGAYQVMYNKHVTLSTTPKSALDDSYDPVPDEDTAGEDLVVIDRTVPPPPGLHANLLTSLIGFFTWILLWIPIPLLDYFNIETFSLPTNAHTYFTIAGIAFTGVLFNAGFMVLLGVWGPVITSVGNLLTIVLVLLSDLMLGGSTDTITVWSLVGSGAIVSAFGVLAYDMLKPDE
ncbi:hypothetical protein FIBSPDRAFT_1037809 [Athelia psychrophila]|uniref:EamA domain-containing protein n=1 Tax=Athelia psychrophila TaxID=1759441 RepID=A0A166U6H5_9AGAM|nr:hypothetical protein FIBSPDRAFT_1037809 [Fibularhizoctonia sp. CBS 109695]